ncbi:MAG: ferric reductase-like transmembrane domain-containing protein [Pseudomonadota bacterium]
MLRLRELGPWVALALATGVPLYAAATSPLLQWRDTVYQVAGFAGALALALLLVQPLLAGRLLPGLRAPLSVRAHRWVGTALVLAVLVHVGGLWITSPPDVIDALSLNSPTPFSLWGVMAMWAVFATAVLALSRRRWRLRPRTWLLCHGSLTVVIVAGTVAHAVLIEGTMATGSKVALCVLVVAASATVLMRAARRVRR